MSDLRRQTPPSRSPAACKRTWRGSGFDRVGPLPSSPLVDVTVSPIFLPTVPERKPRTEWGNQPVALISSLAVTPFGRLSRSRILAVLLPSRATSGLAALASLLGAFAFVRPLGAFLAGVAFFPALVLAGATGARRGARVAFLLSFGLAPSAVAGAVSVSSGINVVICFLLLR